jgi:hypothetical protein
MRQLSFTENTNTPTNHISCTVLSVELQQTVDEFPLLPPTTFILESSGVKHRLKSQPPIANPIITSGNRLIRVQEAATHLCQLFLLGTSDTSS